MLHIHDLGFVPRNVPDKLPLHLDAAHDLGFGHCISELIYDRQRARARAKERVEQEQGQQRRHVCECLGREFTAARGLGLVENSTDFTPHGPRGTKREKRDRHQHHPLTCVRSPAEAEPEYIARGNLFEQRSRGRHDLYRLQSMCCDPTQPQGQAGRITCR